VKAVVDPKQQLEEQGFVVTEQVDAAVLGQQGSSISYRSGQLDKAKLLQRYVELLPNIHLGDSNMPGADIEITLGRNFEHIVIPADALATTATTLSPDPSAVEGILDVPIDIPPQATELVLPNPAPRIGCSRAAAGGTAAATSIWRGAVGAGLRDLIPRRLPRARACHRTSSR
jgi:hypothetical protein